MPAVVASETSDASNNEQRLNNPKNLLQDKLKHVIRTNGTYIQTGNKSAESIEAIIGEHGLVVITRAGSNPQKFIYESDTLTRYIRNIVIVPEWISNEVSSTKIRRALRRQESVKYLINDAVIDFIMKNGLYGTQNDFKYMKIQNDNLNIPLSNYMLTPSPTDIVMSCSPTNSQNIILNLNALNDMNCNVTETDYGQGSKAVFIKPQESNMGIYETLETFQSRAEIKFTADRNEENTKRSHKVIKSESKVVQYPGAAVQVVTEKKLEEEAAKLKKVGFKDKSIDYEYVTYDICETPSNWLQSPKKVVASVKNIPEIQKINDENKVIIKKEQKVESETSEHDSTLQTTPPKISPKKCKKTPKRNSKTPDLCRSTKPVPKNDQKRDRFLKRSNSDAVMSNRNEKGETASVKIQFTKDGVKVISDKESIV